MNKPQIVAICSALLLIVFICTDCSLGNHKYYECTVVGKNYKPPWVQVTTSIDADGNVHVNTIHHPEEYHVHCRDLESDKMFDIETTSGYYYSINNGEYTNVKVNKGRWTGIEYIPRIER